MVVRKYWVDPEGDMVKDTELKPELIELHQANSDWVENTAEQTDETSVFYLTTALEPGDTSDLFDTFRLSERLVEINEDGLVITSEKQGDKTIYTYNYPYDGYQCYIEAEAQSIQTHNGTDAVRSIWGVENVTASGTSLSVG